MEEETVRRVVLECVQPGGESRDEEKLIDDVGGGQAGMGSGAELEDFNSLDELRRANLIAASDPDHIFDTSGIPTSEYLFVKQPLVVFM